jgi:spermidine/putrescine transport system substrate-binding protein
MVMLLVLYLPSIIKKMMPSDELNICTFADLISEDLLEQFTKETGIKVNCKYCELDSEIWTQLSMSEGKGLDIVTPIDATAARLTKAKLLQKVNKKLLPSLGGYHQVFLNKDFDPDLEYNTPFAWTYYAIGYNKSFFEPYEVVPTSLQAIFEPDKVFKNNLELLNSYKVIILEDNPQELLFLGALYNSGTIANLTQPEERKKIKKLFIAQKRNWLYAYVSANMQYYLNSVVPVAITFAALLKELIDEERESFGCCFPEEGSALVAQNFCIPVGSKNVEAAHKFINFFMSDKMLLEVFNSSGYLPVKENLLTVLKEENPDLESFIPTEEQMQKLVSSNSIMTDREIQHTWLAVKCAS